MILNNLYKMKLNGTLYEYRFDIESLIELDNRYDNSVEIFIECISENYDIIEVVENYCKILSSSIKNAYIDENELLELFIHENKNIINTHKKLVIIIEKLLAGFLQESSYNNNNVDNFENIDIDISYNNLYDMYRIDYLVNILIKEYKMSLFDIKSMNINNIIDLFNISDKKIDEVEKDKYIEKNYNSIKEQYPDFAPCSLDI